MGVIRWLTRIDPQVWGRACERLASAPPSDAAEAENFLRAFGREFEPYVVASFDDLADDPSIHSTLLNGLLETAVKEESWELDKSLSHGLEQLPGSLESLASLKKIIDFKGIDVEVPKTCTPDDGSGLFGCLSPQALTDCVGGVGRYQTSADVAAELRTVRPGTLARFFGGRQRLSALASKLEEEYFAEHWKSLRTAILETHRQSHYLGLGMSI